MVIKKYVTKVICTILNVSNHLIPLCCDKEQQEGCCKTGVLNVFF